MTDRSRRRRRLTAAFLAGSLAFVAAACAGPRRPPAPRRSTPTLVETLRSGGRPLLQPYLDAYPLGSLGTRVDLLAETNEHSMHFVQAARPIARHRHPARTETVYVLTGSGTCYLGGKSYPAVPGSAFRIEPGVAHGVIPAEGSTLVAIAYFEPPLSSGDDRVPAE